MDLWYEFLIRTLWYGGSTFDAWLNLVSAKMAARLLTFQQSTAQLGLHSAIVFQLALGAMGFWAHCIINILFLKYKNTQSQDMEVQRQEWHTTQLHEVIGGLLGPRWRMVSYGFNITTVYYVCYVQLIACGDIAYSLNDNLDKRTWTLIFGAVFCLSVVFPSAQNYRVWSYVGVVTITFVSGYMTVGSLLQGKIENIRYSSPHSYSEYFTGISGCIIFGNVPIPIEIMHAMRKPHEYQMTYFYAVVSTLSLVIVPSISMYQMFGDKLITTPNSMVLLQSSKFRDTANVLMLIHEFINFGMYSIAMYSMWEKILHVHDSPSYTKRTLSRIPIYMTFLVAALAVPFFGIINRVIDATLVIWNFFIIPCAAYHVVFWPRDQHKRVKPFTRLGWALDFSVNLGVILGMLIVSVLSLWGEVDTFIKLKSSLKPFAKCYRCSPRKT